MSGNVDTDGDGIYKENCEQTDERQGSSHKILVFGRFVEIQIVEYLHALFEESIKIRDWLSKISLNFPKFQSFLWSIQ